MAEMIAAGKFERDEADESPFFADALYRAYRDYADALDVRTAPAFARLARRYRRTPMDRYGRAFAAFLREIESAEWEGAVALAELVFRAQPQPDEVVMFGFDSQVGGLPPHVRTNRSEPIGFLHPHAAVFVGMLSQHRLASPIHNGGFEYTTVIFDQREAIWFAYVMTDQLPWTEP